MNRERVNLFEFLLRLLNKQPRYSMNLSQLYLHALQYLKGEQKQCVAKLVSHELEKAKCLGFIKHNKDFVRLTANFYGNGNISPQACQMIHLESLLAGEKPDENANGFTKNEPVDSIPKYASSLSNCTMSERQHILVETALGLRANHNSRPLPPCLCFKNPYLNVSGNNGRWQSAVSKDLFSEKIRKILNNRKRINNLQRPFKTANIKGIKNIIEKRKQKGKVAKKIVLGKHKRSQLEAKAVRAAAIKKLKSRANTKPNKRVMAQKLNNSGQVAQDN